MKLVFLTVACFSFLKKGITVPFLVVEKHTDTQTNRLPRYIFLIWQDNIVQIICMFQKRTMKV